MNINWTDVKTFFINQNEVTKIQLNGTTLWQKSSGPTPGPDYTEPFYIEDLSGSSNNIVMAKIYEGPSLTVEYSSDKTNWSSITFSNTSDRNISLSANGKVYFRCTTNSWSNTGKSVWFKNATGNIKVGGNIMSLLFGSSFTGQETTLPSSTYTFSNIFKENYSLVDASDLLLPATTLVSNCYNGMFFQCTALSTPPTILPATTLQPYCYYEMFCKCYALTATPVLPATTLATCCYSSMFNYCLYYLTQAPALPATTLAYGCYQNMFYYCTSLTTAPELPATTLADFCYYGMFTGCSSLEYIKCLATDVSQLYCTYNWVKNVSASGTFVKDATMSSWTTGIDGIPTGWTVEDAS